MRPIMFATFVVAGCLLGVQAGVAQDKTSIQSLNEKFAADFNSGNFTAVASHYTEDAILLPPGAEMIKGRSAIQTFWKGAAEGISDLKLTAMDVKALGTDAAREVGTFTLKTKGQQAQEVAGKYVVVWQKVGNEWKLATDIWNTNK
jgi:uncharacterized protein (TIGR02246 family)